MEASALIRPEFWKSDAAVMMGGGPEVSVPGLVFFRTSGSTGTPKWIGLSRRALLVSAGAVNQHLDVTDPRHVRQNALFVGQQARGEQRQRRVLVALNRVPTFEPSATFYLERGHIGSETQIDNLCPQPDAELVEHAPLALLHQIADLGGGCAAVVHDEVGVRRRHT